MLSGAIWSFTPGDHVFFNPGKFGLLLNVKYLYSIFSCQVSKNTLNWKVKERKKSLKYP